MLKTHAELLTSTGEQVGGRSLALSFAEMHGMVFPQSSFHPLWASTEARLSLSHQSYTDS